MNFWIPTKAQVSKGDFVKYWSRIYDETQSKELEVMYERNVGGSLARQDTLDLFHWKFGRKLTGRYLDLVNRNFIPGDRDAPHSGELDKVKEFILRPGGVIWRIFWLHCLNPSGFPIYDQNVHRAMSLIMDEEPREISAYYPNMAASYVEMYEPFFRVFHTEGGRVVDKALWVFGKIMKNPVNRLLYFS